MDDTNLLDLAGRAAGEKYDADNNPLWRDDLALRLAVRLRMKLQITEHGAAARIYLVASSLVALDEVPDVESATRLAIVRAAAEIGQSMP